jgi:hypothetical protein
MKLLFPFIFMASTTLSVTATQDYSPHEAKPTSATAQTLVTLFSTANALLNTVESEKPSTQSLQALMRATMALLAETCGKSGTEKDELMLTVKKTFQQAIGEAILDLDNTKDTDYKHQSNLAKDPEAVQATMCNVANIVSGVVNIAQNPHDKQNVGHSVGAILCSIINLAVQASHRSSSPLQVFECYLALATATEQS